MSTHKHLNIKDIKLDLFNYRTVPQKTEVEAVNTMIAIKPDRFYAVIESLISDGYLETENLIILDDNGYIVKEGNRRTAALKLIHGIYDKDDFSLPDSIKKQIDEIDPEWIKNNTKIPCSIYSVSEKDKVARIVNLTHAKGEKASRDPWTSVAKARQNRNEKKGSEPALDLLEKYLELGNNLTRQQKERWSGDYPYTVLEEALRIIVTRLELNSVKELSEQYPKIKYREPLENIMQAIGLELFGFKEIRSKDSDFAESYGVPKPPVEDTPDSESTQEQSSNDTEANSDSDSQNNNESSDTNDTTNPGEPHTSSSGSGTSDSSSSSTGSSGRTSRRNKATPINDQRTVTNTLKKFAPQGNNRAKLVTLRDELKKLKVKQNPIAFCFILRSMFEISAKIYCEENAIPLVVTKRGKTKDKTLKQLLQAATGNLTTNNTNQGMIKALHGANSELGKSEGLLSVTSMNQLVHNPSFSIASNDIFTLFNNVYPLLEAMN